jgi:uncharacterized protein
LAGFDPVVRRIFVLITLQELQLHSVRFTVDIPAGEIAFDNKVTQSSVLHAEGVAELVSYSLGDIRLRGNLQVTVAAPCDRCLEPVALPIQDAFDLVYTPASEAAEGGEEEIDDAAVEVGFYEGNGIQLNDVLREVILLALPMQLVCNEGCKGICPICGQNRNQRECACQTAAADDRWNKLKDLRTEIGQRH